MKERKKIESEKIHLILIKSKEQRFSEKIQENKNGSKRFEISNLLDPKEGFTKKLPSAKSMKIKNINLNNNTVS